MTKTKLIRALLLLLACFCALPAAAEEKAPPLDRVGGYIITYQGNRLEIVRFKNLLPEYPFRYQGMIQSLPMNRIKSLAIKSGGVLLERRDGVSIKVTGSLVISAGPALEFVFKDSFNGGEMDGQMDPVLISLVVFN